jgi:RNA polymerase sigma factor (sigma-70 family)
VDDKNDEFRDLLRRVCESDENAAKEFVEKYGPTIRTAAKSRLKDPGLRRLVESKDVLQAVLLSFFRRAPDGHYKPTTVEEFLSLLRKMTRNKALKEIRRHRSARRDNRRNADLTNHDLPEQVPGPAQRAEAKDFLASVRGRLTPEDVRLFELLGKGYSYAEIAPIVGSTPGALRIQAYRVRERLRKEVSDE